MIMHNLNIKLEVNTTTLIRSETADRSNYLNYHPFQVYSSGKTWKKGCSTCVCNEGVKMCSECSKTSTCTTDQGKAL